MALVLFDRVKETSTTTGTGTVVLNGASAGYQSFAVVGDTNTTYYTIAGQTTSEWEVGIGTYYTGNVSLARTTILTSSNANTAVTFSAGTKDVFITYPAEKSVGSQTGYFDDTFKGTFVDGVVVDYDSAGSVGRISVGASDGINFYNGGVSGSLLGSVASTGNWRFFGNAQVGNGSLIGGATNPLIEAAGSAPGYVQVYVHNDSTNASASSDLAAYPDNGLDSSGWIDMGITSSTYADAAYPITVANEGYIFMSAPSGASKSGNIIYATDSTGTTNAHQWYVGGFSQAKAAWKMQLNSSGLQLANALPITSGGTGATSAGAALTSLGAQANLVSGTSIKTVNSSSLLGSGDVAVQPTLVSATNIKTINGASVLGSGDLTVSGSFSGGTLTSQLIAAAGTATAGTAPIEFQSGPLNTAAEIGAMEFDGFSPYFSIANSTRGAIPAEQWIVLSSTNTLTSQTGVQPIFDGGGGPTNGSVTLPIGTYQFECVYALTAMSATSGSFGFSLGGAATKTFTYDSTASKAGTAAATAQAGFKLFSSAAATTLVTNSTGTVGSAVIKGIIRVTVAGTIIPQVSLTVAAAAVVSANSYFKVSPIGSSTVVSVGNWA